MQNVLTKNAEIKSESLDIDRRTKYALSEGVIQPKSEESPLDFLNNRIQILESKEEDYFNDRISYERKLLSQYPDNVKLLIRVGDIYATNKKYDKAKIYFNRALRKNPDNLSIIKKLVDVYIAKQKFSTADKLLDFVSEKLDYDTTHLHGVLKYLLGNFEGSEETIKGISVESPRYFEAINTLGLVHLAKNEFTDAKKSFEISINAKPDYAPAKSNLAIALQNLNKVSEAIDQYKKTIIEHHNFVVAYHNLFNLYVKDENYQEAYELMDSARDLVTPDNEIQFRIGWSLMRMGKYTEAILEYEHLLTILQGNSPTLNNIGHCYDSIGNTEKAYEYFDKASKTKYLNLFQLVPYRNLMVVAEKCGRIKQSQLIARNILTHFPDDPFSLVYRGSELVELEEYKEALPMLIKAYEDKPPLIALYISLSFLYAEVYSDYDKGMEVCNFVLDNKMNKWQEILNNIVHLNLINGHIEIAEKYTDALNPQNAISLCTLALYDLQRDMVEESINKYNKALKLSNKKMKSAIKQRKYYDLVSYYVEKNDTKNARKLLNLWFDSGEKGFKLVDENMQKISDSLA